MLLFANEAENNTCNIYTTFSSFTIPPFRLSLHVQSRDMWSLSNKQTIQFSSITFRRSRLKIPLKNK